MEARRAVLWMGSMISVYSVGAERRAPALPFWRGEGGDAVRVGTHRAVV